MNEFYFIIQVILVFLFSYGAFRLGKEALIAAVALQGILANFFVLKQMYFLGFEVTCSDAFAIGSILCINILREFFDKESAKKAIFISFLLMVFFVIASQIHLQFIPTFHDTSHYAYKQLLTPAPRLLFASIAVFYLIQHFDLHAFNLITKLLQRSPFSIRSSLSLATSQLLDTVCFSFLGLYGIVENVFHIILISFLLKLVIISLLGPFLSFMKKQRKYV